MFSPYNFHYVCLECRRAVKSGVRQSQIPCSICRSEMTNMGRKFAAPRKKDDAQWKKLEWMIQNGWRGYGSASRPGWVTRPKMNLREVQESLAISTQRIACKAKEDAALLERRRAAQYSYSRSKTTKKHLEAEWKRQEKYQKAVLASVATKEHRPA